MEIKTRIKLSIILIVCMFAALTAGCVMGEGSLDDYLKDNGAEIQCVTYYGNGGTFNENDTKTVMDVYYKPDSYIISSQQEKFSVNRIFYDFDAWYYGQLDGEGKPVLDKDGNLILTSKKLGDKEKIAAGEHKYVGAKWNAKVALEIYLVADGFDVTSGDTVYKNGDKLKTVNFGSDKYYGLSEKTDAVAAKDATFLSFYSDEACTNPITSVAKPGEANAENVKIYAKYLQGKWTVVRNATNVVTMFNNSSNGGNYYLFTSEPNGEIDCTGRKISLSSYNFNIKIEGNGVTIRNLKFESLGISGGPYSIFGRFAAEAKIKDLTIKDIEVSVTAKSNLNGLYLVTHGNDGADISGLKIENASLSVTSASLILNIQNNNTDNWLFGGYETDDMYLTEKAGIKVTAATLKINGEVLAENISK